VLLGTQATRAAEDEAKRKKQEDKERKKARKAEKKAGEAAEAGASAVKSQKIDGTVKNLPIREKVLDKEGPLTTGASTVPESTAPKTE
jgi:methionyl-tRNA synthetase